MKRVFLGMLLLIGAAILFHRPLLRWGLNWGAPRLAKAAGYELQWEVRGSITSDVTVRSLKLRGPDTSPLRSIDCGHISADYSVWTLLTEGTGSFLHALEVSDLSADMDTRIKPQAKPPKKTGGGPPEVWADRVSLRNISLHMVTPGGEVNLRGLSLLLDGNEPGEVVINDLTVSASQLHLAGVRGKTSVAGRTVILSEVNVTPEVRLARLEVGLGELAKAAVPFQVELRSGGGTLKGGGRVQDLDAQPWLEVQLSLQQLSEVDVARWVRLPQGLTWRVENASLNFKGPPAQPQKIEATFVLDATGVHVGGLNGEKLHAEATLALGNLRVPSLSWFTKGNGIAVTASAALPATWREMRRLSADVQWSVDAPRLDDFFDAPSKISGSLRGTGEVSLKEGQLGSAQGALDGQQIRYDKWTLASVSAEVATDAESVQVKSLVARLDEKNSATVRGNIQLSGRQAADFSLELKADDVAAMARMAGMKDAETMQAGKAGVSGSVQLTIADLREKNLGNLAAQGTAMVEAFAWRERRLQSVSLEFGLKQMRVEVSKAEVRFDPGNRALFSGGMQLDGKQPSNVTWDIQARDLSAMGAWLAWKPMMPQPTAGVLVAQGSAHGNVTDLRERVLTGLKAEGTMRLDGLVSDKATLEHAAVNLTCGDGRVELKQFEARVDGLNHLTARGHAKLAKPGEFALDVEGALPELAKLSAWVEMFKGPALTGGSAVVSWKGTGRIFDGDIQGGGSLQLADVKLADRPPFSVTLETTHAGRKAQISALRASTGQFRIDAKADISETDLSIPHLSVFSGEVSLMSGAVELPLALAQQPRPRIPLDTQRPVKVSLHAAKLELGKLFEVFGMKPPVVGVADMDLELHGLLPDLEGRFNMALTGVRAEATKEKLDPASLRVDATLSKDRLSLQASVDQKPLRPLELTGTMPLDPEKLMRDPSTLLDSAVEARVVLPESDLSIVRRFVPAIATLQGKVAADVKVSGTLREPHLAGALVADVSSATLAATPMDIKDLKARVSFEDKQIRLDDVSVMLAGGDVRVTGGVDITELKKPVVDLRLDARQALIVRNESYSARADGVITCKGTLEKAEIAGRAELVRCRVFKEIEFLPLSLPNQLPPPPPAVTVRRPPALPAPFGQWTFNVDIVTRDSIRLLGNVLNGAATAKLHLGGTGTAPELVGDVSFQGVRVRLPNSRLNITRGALIFTKDRPFEPALDVVGESLVGNYEVMINAYGSAFQPKVRFSSSPPLSEGEIATLLATGTVGGGEGAAAGAAANTAAFQVLSKAYRSVFNQTAPKRYDEEPPRLTFSFSPMSTGTSAPGVSANYEISDKLQATGAATERGTFRGMLHYMVRLR